MRIRIFLSICGLVALAAIAKAQDESISLFRLNELKEYFDVDESLADGDDRERFKDFKVIPHGSQVSDTTEYKLEFSVKSETFFKIVNGYLVFQFPEGFGLSELDAAGIRTNFGFVSLLVTGVKTEDQFVILNYVKVVLDTLWDSTMVPERVNFDVKLFKVINPDKARKYEITGAAIRDHEFVAWPKKSEKFEITEFSEEPKAELQIISTELIAPNSPKVNTNQEVAVEVLVANVSNLTAHNVDIGLSSDGGSSINSPKTIEVLEANDTAAVSFEVTAARESGSENFTSDILSSNVIEVEAVDDTAAAVIQTPANLILTSSVEDGDTVHVEPGKPYIFSFIASNLGEASTRNGEYSFDGGSEHCCSFPVDTEVDIVLYSLLPGTVRSHILEITKIPVDKNVNLPAPIDNTIVEFTVAVELVLDEEFANSFIVENNPFNPHLGPVRLAYNLDSDSDVEFRIFTVTGEEVYSKSYRSGTEGGKAGTNQIEWDGRNSNRDIVLNGVYITMLNVLSTGEKASLKLAVLK